MNPVMMRHAVILSAALSLAGLVRPYAGEPTAGTLQADTVVTAARLIREAAAFDGKKVAIVGEAVGDVMERGSHAWLCVLDDGTAIGVWADSAALPARLAIGGYGARGDTVRVSGVFHRACGDHGGDLDIHLAAMERLAPGSQMAHPVPAGRAVAAFLFCASGGLFTFLWRRRESGA